MTDASEWEGRVGRSWAQEWRRTDRSFGELTDRLVGAARERGYAAALDIGCGAGEVSTALASADTAAHVTGIDLSADLLGVARERAADLPNCRFEQTDAAHWSPQGPAFDLLVSRHGVMFFADPVAAFVHLRGLAQENGALVFTCFRAARLNPWATGLSDLVSGSPPPGSAGGYAPGPFAFADDTFVVEILRAAGWSDVGAEPLDYHMVAGAGADPVGDAVSYFQTIGPAAKAARDLAGEDRAQFLDRLREWAGAHLVAGTVRFPAAAWLVRARAG